jgi:hypothetical protein
MKLRMKNNSVRLRLTQTETARFAETGRIEETIEFGPEPHQKFIYAIETDSEIEAMQAFIENNRIILLMPKTQAETWTGTAQIGVENEQRIGGEKSLRLLVGKDFSCLEPREGEDEKDAYPHPLEGKVC